MFLNKVSSKFKNKSLSQILFLLIYFLKNFRTIYIYHKALRQQSIQDRFVSIYKNNLWRSKESVSGTGSEIAYTQNLRNWLRIAINKYSFNKICDAPCGDFNWMRLVMENQNIEYFGYDIVPELIQRNNNLFSNDRIKFVHCNICVDKIEDCDLLIVRDILFHLSFSDINLFLKNISSVRYKFMLTTSHITASTFLNFDIKSGDFRKLNIFSYPFSFKRENIVESINDFPLEYEFPREMVLISKIDVPTSLDI